MSLTGATSSAVRPLKRAGRGRERRGIAQPCGPPARLEREHIGSSGCCGWRCAGCGFAPLRSPRRASLDARYRRSRGGLELDALDLSLPQCRAAADRSNSGARPRTRCRARRCSCVFSPTRRAKLPSPMGLPTMTACLPSLAVKRNFARRVAPGLAGSSTPMIGKFAGFGGFLLDDLGVAQCQQQLAQLATHRRDNRARSATVHWPACSCTVTAAWCCLCAQLNARHRIEFAREAGQQRARRGHRAGRLRCVLKYSAPRDRKQRGDEQSR